MEVGEYCRTDKGKIGKIVHFEPRDKYPYSYDRVILDTEGYKRTTRNIIKCSPNIIDLIEENDLIEIEYKISTGENQKEIVQVIKSVNNTLFIKTYTEHYVFIEDIEKTIYKIKGIITHEQIESMEYKVKE